MGKIYHTFTLVSGDGTPLHGHYWKPEGKPRACILLVHGIGEHGARYNDWARRFVKLGFFVYALDYRGHGKAQGPRGFVHSLTELMDDVSMLVRRCERNFEDIPWFLYGHSMGGNLVLNFLRFRRQDFAGVVVTSPWLELVHPPKPWLQRLGRWADMWWPEWTFSTGIRSDQMTSVPAEREEADADPLMHGRISLRLFNELNDSARFLMTKGLDFHLPMLLLHGEADPLTSCGATERFAARYPENCSYKGYGGALHELHREPVADLVFSDIVAWMEERLK